MLYISPPFGNYISYRNTTRIRGTFTAERRSGLIWHTLRSLRTVKGGWINQIGFRNKGLHNVFKFDKNSVYSLAAIDNNWIKLFALLPKNTKIELNVTYLGGGFGRRSINDFVYDAVEISKVMEKPVKMIWTREEDMQHDYYRPASLHVMKGAIDNENNLTAWNHRVVAPSILFSQLVKIPFPFKEKLDIISVEGAKNIRYDIPNISVDYRMANTPVPVGWWRSVYDSQNAFANECFMDELAEAAGKDPVEFRLELLPKSSRERNVLNLVAKKANWKGFNSGSYYQGVSFHKSFGTYVAQVARVAVNDNTIKVNEIHCAVDCGTVINPSIVEGQISGAIIYGLSAALKSKITVSNGRVDQSNFDDFDVLRMDETPKIHVYLIESDAAPTGVGEPGLPPAAPAVANAVYAATGKRIRKLPITI
jgi:isoquinoline 1-oxidoreductase beta subunit